MAMKVRELIAMLEKQDPEASVLLMIQPHQPWECGVDRVVTRRSFDEPREPETTSNDVLLLQGAQRRYGSRKAWQR
jgi:hypothetical protein